MKTYHLEFNDGEEVVQGGFVEAGDQDEAERKGAVLWGVPCRARVAEPEIGPKVPQKAVSPLAEGIPAPCPTCPAAPSPEVRAARNEAIKVFVEMRRELVNAIDKALDRLIAEAK